MASPTQWTWVSVNSRSWWWMEAWRAAIHGVTKSRTRLSDWTELSWAYNYWLFQTFPLCHYCRFYPWLSSVNCFQIICHWDNSKVSAPQFPFDSDISLSHPVAVSTCLCFCFHWIQAFKSSLYKKAIFRSHVSISLLVCFQNKFSPSCWYSIQLSFVFFLFSLA